MSTSLILNFLVLQSELDFEDAIYISILGLSMGIVLIYQGVRLYKKKQIVKNTAPEDIRSVALGRTEIRGIGKPIDGYAKTPFIDEECLYSVWKVREYKAESGITKDWTTIKHDYDFNPFIVEDETGQIIVEPTKDATWSIESESECIEVDSNTEPNDVIKEYCRGVDGLDAVSENKRRYIQKRFLKSGDEVYVLGEATPINDDNYPSKHDLKIERDKSSRYFIISNKDDDSIKDEFGNKWPILIVMGIALAVIGLSVILGRLGI